MLELACPVPERGGKSLTAAFGCETDGVKLPPSVASIEAGSRASFSSRERLSGRTGTSLAQATPGPRFRQSRSRVRGSLP